MLGRSGFSVEAGRPLPVPKTLRDLVHGRLLALPPDSRDFLLAAAAHPHPTIAVTEAASGVSRLVGLTPALESGIVEVDEGRIRFTHSLLAAGAYEMADPLRRPEIHARLAKLLVDPESRAWQLAASVGEADEAVAAVLEEVAQRAHARGAPGPAAVLLDRAYELTPRDDSERGLRRAVDAAFLHYESGDALRAEASLRDLIEPLTPGRLRARALMVLARIRLMTPPETLRTARLVLRKPTRQDATLMFAAYGQDHEVARYVTWRPHTCVSDSEALIGRFLDSWRDGSGFHWLLF